MNLNKVYVKINLDKTRQINRRGKKDRQTRQTRKEIQIDRKIDQIEQLRKNKNRDRQIDRSIERLPK